MSGTSRPPNVPSTVNNHKHERHDDADKSHCSPLSLFTQPQYHTANQHSSLHQLSSSYVGSSLPARFSDENPGSYSSRRGAFSGFYDHDRLNHSDKPADCAVRCPHCGEIVSKAHNPIHRESDLRRHIRAEHGEGTRVYCNEPDCDKSFMRNDALRRHQKNAHKYSYTASAPRAKTIDTI